MEAGIPKEEVAFIHDADTEIKKKELFSKAVVNFLNYYNFDAKVKLFTDIREFEKYLKKIETGKTSPTPEQKEHMEVVFEKVSIMSI